MSQVRSLTGPALPLEGGDIDTDRIIPARFLRCVTFDGLGEQVFADDRHQRQGQHPFDLPQYQGATILVVNANFGCGSSREHAPQALIKWGIKGLIGESFAEIFFGNCVANGVPCVTADPSAIKALQAYINDHPQAKVTLDLANLEVRYGDQALAITMPEGPRQMLLSGQWDSCGQLLQHQDAITTTAQALPYLHWQTA
ncbi:3-isopropylmalate dehydratase small subunit [Synechocystis sp. LKSZ1]|uniref:3-isopropylmalate dehydratase small subunit n=1 Tax=Synechocystis sp. LKSZ1 TaxID=3144951 RepID=UPI00336BB83B